MTDTDDMVHITEGKLEQLVRQDGTCIGKAEQRMVRKHGAQPHGARMQNRLMAETAQTGVAMHDLDLLADDNVAEDGEEGEDGGHGRFPVDDEERDMVDLESVGEVADPGAALVRMGDDDNLVAAIDEFSRQLVDMTLNPTWLGEEEVTDHAACCQSRGRSGGGPSLTQCCTAWWQAGLSRRARTERVRSSIHSSMSAEQQEGECRAIV